MAGLGKLPSVIEGDFGGTIKASRERLGLSQSRVAELVGRTQATVRSWEHGRTAPTDAGTIKSLAAILALDEEDMFRAAGLEPPAPRSQLTMEQILSEIAPANLPPVVSRAPAPQPERGPEATPAPLPIEIEEPTLAQPVGRGRHQRTEAVPVPQPRLSVLPPEQPQELSYTEDPSQRVLYRFRALATAIGVVPTAVLFLWAYQGAAEAFTIMWDILTENL